MKKLHTSDWLKMSAFSCNMSAKLWHNFKLQIRHTCFKKFCLSLFTAMFFMYIINK